MNMNRPDMTEDVKYKDYTNKSLQMDSNPVTMKASKSPAIESSDQTKAAKFEPLVYRVEEIAQLLAISPETNCQGLFNQIHKKGARSTVWLLTPRLIDYIFPFSRSLQRYA